MTRRQYNNNFLFINELRNRLELFRMRKPANKQASKQANKQTSKQANNQTNKQASKRNQSSQYFASHREMTRRQYNNNFLFINELRNRLELFRMRKRANKQASKQANKQTSKQANKQTSKQTNKQTNEARALNISRIIAK